MKRLAEKDSWHLYSEKNKISKESTDNCFFKFPHTPATPYSAFPWHPTAGHNVPGTPVAAYEYMTNLSSKTYDFVSGGNTFYKIVIGKLNYITQKTY